MAAKPNTAAFLDRLFEHVPEEQRAAARPAYSALQDRLNAVDQTYQQQSAWWEANKDAVQERDRLAQEIAQLRGQQQQQPQGSGAAGGQVVDQNAITAAIQEASARTLETGLGLVTTITNLAVGHMKEFGEPIDAQKLAQDAIAARMPIDQFYAQLVAPKRAERQTAELNARIEAAKAEGVQAGRQEVLSRMGKDMPYPSPSGQPAVTTLTGLRKPVDGAPNQFSLEAAVATANEVMAGGAK